MKALHDFFFMEDEQLSTSDIAWISVVGGTALLSIIIGASTFIL